MCEILDAGRWPVRELYLAQELPEGELAAAMDNKSDRLAHRPFLSRMSVFTAFAATGTIRDTWRAWARFLMCSGSSQVPPLPLYVVLDGIRDAHNFGAIIRSAAALGSTAVIAGGAGQTPINSQAVRASAGAVNRIPIALEDTLDATLNQLHAQGVYRIAAMAKAETPAWACNFLGPTALIFGNEGRGIRPEVLEHCDGTAAIPLDRPWIR